MDRILPNQHQMELLQNFGYHLVLPLVIGGGVFKYHGGKLPFRWNVDTQCAVMVALITEVTLVAARYFYLQPTPTSTSPALLTPKEERDLKKGIEDSFETLAKSWEKGINHQLTLLLSSTPEKQGELVEALQKKIEKMRASLPEEGEQNVASLLDDTEAFIREIRNRLEELDTLRSRVKGSISLSKTIYTKLQKGLEGSTTLDKASVSCEIEQVENQLSELQSQEMTESLISQVSETKKQLDEAKVLLKILSEDMTAELRYRQDCLDVEKDFIEKLEKQLGGKLKEKLSDGNCLFSSLEEFSDKYAAKDGSALRVECVTKALEEMDSSPDKNNLIHLQIKDAIEIGRFEGYPASFRENLEKLQADPEAAEKYLEEANKKELVKDYWEAMTTLKSFGGEVEMYIIADLLNVYIVVYQGIDKLPEGEIRPSFTTAEICDETGCLKKDLKRRVVSLFRYGSQDHFAPILVD